MTTAANSSNEYKFSPELCYKYERQSVDILERTFYGVGIPVVCLLGAFCDILMLITLNTPRKFTASTHVFFRFLALFQTFTLLGMIFESFDAVFISDQMVGAILVAYGNWPMLSFSSTLCLVFSVAATMERYINLTKPVLSISKLRQRRSTAKLTSHLLICLVFVFNAPRMFAFKVDWRTGCKIVRWGDWFVSYSYIRLYGYNFVFVVVLLVVHILTLNSMRFSKNIKAEYAIQALAEPAVHHHRRQEKSLTITLLICVFITLLGELPALLLNPLIAQQLWQMSIKSAKFLEMQRVIKVIKVVEYSTIFFVFFFFDKPFRMAFRTRFKRWQRQINKINRKNCHRTSQVKFSQNVQISSNSQQRISIDHSIITHQRRIRNLQKQQLSRMTIRRTLSDG